MQVQGGVAERADGVHGDGDLTVGLLAQRPAVLPLNADGVRALLGKGHVVEHEVAGPVDQDPKKTSIHLNRRTAFAGVVVRKDCIVVTIKANSPIASPRIFKLEQTTAKRFHHEVKLAAVRDLDAELRGWLKAAYELSE